MRRVALSLMLVSFLFGDTVSAQVLPDGKVEREVVAGGSRIEARLPGLLLGYAAMRDGALVREILLLVGSTPVDLELEADSEEEGEPVPPVYRPCGDEGAPPLALWRLSLRDDSPVLEQVRDDLPADATTIDAVDLDRDGRDDLLLSRPGELLRFPSGDGSGMPVAVLKDEDYEVRLSGSRSFDLDGQGNVWIRVSGVGFHRFYHFDDDIAEFRLVTQVDVGTGTNIMPGAMRIWTPRLTSAGSSRNGNLLFTSWPQVLGRRRVRTDLIEPAAAEESGRKIESWGRLPGEERPVERFARVLDGRPVLILTTVPEGKLNLFGEKLLRIFPVAPDRSRNGLRPILETSSRMNIWQACSPYLLDVDGDERSDLVLGYWKGLKDDKVVLDAYLRDESGGFRLTPRSTGFNVKDGDRSSLLYGEDLVGDRSADLVVRGGGNLFVHPGSAGTKTLVSKTPSHVIPLGEVCEDAEATTEISIGVRAGADGMSVTQFADATSVPRALDLDGDSRPELIIVQPWSCNAGRLRLFTLAPF